MVKPIKFLFLRDPSREQGACRISADFRQSAETSPLQTAIHVAQQKIGLKIPPNRVYYVKRWLAGRPESHWRYLFCTDLYGAEERLVNLNYRGPTHEVPFWITAEDTQQSIDAGKFYGSHVFVLEDVGFLPKTLVQVAHASAAAH